MFDDFHWFCLYQVVDLLFEGNNRYSINADENFLQEIMLSHYQDQEMYYYQMVLNDELVEY
jgi:hypothetical protein